jgi:hypothetical protein
VARRDKRSSVAAQCIGVTVFERYTSAFYFFKRGWRHGSVSIA